jgi:hypothetical protein
LTRPLRNWRLVANPEVEATDPHAQAVLFCNETVGTLVRNNLLDRELVYGWLWVSGILGARGSAARRPREKAGVPQTLRTGGREAVPGSALQSPQTERQYARTCSGNARTLIGFSR